MLFNSGGQHIVIRQWELPVTEQGIHAGLTLTLQLLLAIILSMVLTFTTTPRDLTRGTERLARPLKRLHLPVEEAGVILLLAMRFVPLLQQSCGPLLRPEISGVEFAGWSCRKIRTLSPAGPLLMGTSDEATCLAWSLRVGFGQGSPDRNISPTFCSPDYGVFLWRFFFVVYSYSDRLFVSI
jgi:energy-coupling factor transport system permease protein